MLNCKKIAVVVPAYNEETQIGIVLDTMPDFVDRIVVINDCSKDRTEQIVKEYIERQRNKETIEIPAISTEIEETLFNRADIIAAEMNKEEDAFFHPHKIYNDNSTDRIVLINNLINGKIGKALSVGYKWCRDHGIDCTAVMAGDAQMDPGELESICRPVIEENIDYVKGNRLSHKAAKRMIPPKRRFGNSVLSALTKVASGYWRISDTQTGYTAISLHGLNSLDLYSLYPTYGVPNDILIKLNIAKCTLREIPIKPVYAVGEQSKMKIVRVIPTVSWLLIRGYYARIWKKYFLNDFHPIFLLHIVSIVTCIATLYFLVLILGALCINSPISVGTYMGFIALLIVFLVSLIAIMWMDVSENEDLQR